MRLSKYKVLKYFGLFAFIAVLLAGCTNDKPLPSGYELLPRENKGDVLVKTVRANKASTYWKTPTAGSRNTLLLGSYDHVKSFIAMRFLTYSILDTPSVNSAVVRLTQNYHIGDGDSISVSVYPINSDHSWVEAEVLWKEIKDQFIADSLVARFKVAPIDSGIIEFPLDLALVNQWVSDQFNDGIVMIFDNADFMAELYSSNASSNWAKLHVTYTKKDGTPDTTDLDVLSDASLLQFESPTPEYQLDEQVDKLLVGNLTGYRSIIDFDLSGIPQNATIHNVLLNLHIDGENSNTRSFGMRIKATPILNDSLAYPENLQFATDSKAAVDVALSSLQQFDFSSANAMLAMNTIFQGWVSGQLQNYGLGLLPADAGLNASKMSFYSGFADSSLAPTAQITYSVPPSGRFDP
ncbi:MAG: DNRLRE domain-containing protein [Actinobacteria bacterium]|nr:DNRLRE domain-containing protein [Actinomycetota bacterium]